MCIHVVNNTKFGVKARLAIILQYPDNTQLPVPLQSGVNSPWISPPCLAEGFRHVQDTRNIILVYIPAMGGSFKISVLSDATCSVDLDAFILPAPSRNRPLPPNFEKGVYPGLEVLYSRSLGQRRRSLT